MAAPSALGATILSEYKTIADMKLKPNEKIVYVIFVIVILFIVLFVIFYKPPAKFEKGKTIRWVVTGDTGSGGTIEDNSGVVYSYGGFNYLKSEGDFLTQQKAAAYGRSYDNDNFFWAIGGVKSFSNVSFSTTTSILNSYNGYDWKLNSIDLEETNSIIYAQTGNNEPLWLATGLNGTEHGLCYGRDNRIFSSRNGVDWTKTSGVSFGSGWSLSYGKDEHGNHMYQAGVLNFYFPNAGNHPFPADANHILYSYEGLNWLKSSGAKFQPHPTNGEPRFNQYGARAMSIEFGLDDSNNYLWVATGIQYNTYSSILFSRNGISWEYSTGADFGGGFLQFRLGNHVCFGLDDLNNYLWVASGANPYILFSRNGISWSIATVPSDLDINFVSSVEFGKDENDDILWVAAARGTNSENQILISRNGTSWESSENTVFSSDKFKGAEGVASNILKYGVKPF